LSAASYYSRTSDLLYYAVDDKVVSWFGRWLVSSLSFGREPMGTRIRTGTTDTQAKSLADKLEMSTAEIGLSVRTTNCLEERGIYTVNDLLCCTREDLLSISNFGEKTLEEVFKALESIGFRRGGRCNPTASPPQPR
jgi:DNA-directed RNA polymerase subunit alpha